MFLPITESWSNKNQIKNEKKTADLVLWVGWNFPSRVAFRKCVLVLLKQRFKEKGIHTENLTLPVLQNQLLGFFHITQMPKAKQMVE